MPAVPDHPAVALGCFALMSTVPATRTPNQPSRCMRNAKNSPTASRPVSQSGNRWRATRTTAEGPRTINGQVHQSRKSGGRNSRTDRSAVVSVA